MYILTISDGYEFWAEGPYTYDDAMTRRNYLWDAADERGESLSIEMYPYREAADR